MEKIRKNKSRIGKKGVSPVVTTVLLIVLVLIVAMIIFVWAKGWFKEQTQKFNEPIERACESVDLNVQLSDMMDSLDVINQGAVPVFKIALKLTDASGSEIDVFDTKLGVGDSKTIDLSETGRDYSIYKKIEVLPILLGKKGNEDAEKRCDKNPILVYEE